MRSYTLSLVSKGSRRAVSRACSLYGQQIQNTLYTKVSERERERARLPEMNSAQCRKEHLIMFTQQQHNPILITILISDGKIN